MTRSRYLKHTGRSPRSRGVHRVLTIRDARHIGSSPRGSAKSGQVVGWVMSLMARFGCRDRDLAVEAIAAWAPWARRMRPGGQVALDGHDLGAVTGAQLVAVLIEDDITDRRGAGSRFPSALGPRRQPARAACSMGSEQTRVCHLNVLPALDGPGTSDLENLSRSGEVHPLGCLDGLGRCAAPAARGRCRRSRRTGPSSRAGP